MGVAFKSGVTSLLGGDASKVIVRGISHDIFINKTVQGRKVYKSDLDVEQHSVLLVQLPWRHE